LTHNFGASIGQMAAVATPSPSAVSAPSGSLADASVKPAPPATPLGDEMRADASHAAPTAAPVSALQAAIEKVGAYLVTAGQSLQLGVDPQSRHTIVVVRDTQTGTVIRQIPSEEMLRLASTLGTDSHVLIDFTV
jgi:flagellar protein FlaG